MSGGSKVCFLTVARLGSRTGRLLNGWQSDGVFIYKYSSFTLQTHESLDGFNPTLNLSPTDSRLCVAPSDRSPSQKPTMPPSCLPLPDAPVITRYRLGHGYSLQYTLAGFGTVEARTPGAFGARAHWRGWAQVETAHTGRVNMVTVRGSIKFNHIKFQMDFYLIDPRSVMISTVYTSHQTLAWFIRYRLYCLHHSSSWWVLHHLANRLGLIQRPLYSPWKKNRVELSRCPYKKKVRL